MLVCRGLASRVLLVSAGPEEVPPPHFLVGAEDPGRLDGN